MIELYFIIKVVIRSVLALIIGAIIGSERAKHGHAAGMRTHILVCLGATLTSLTSVYLYDVMGYPGDVMRISAQVISGIGFLGVGMIIVKNNNVISGLTTAAGVWTTSIIGIALGYGFYIGALIVSVLLFIAIVLLAKLEKSKRRNEMIYIEIDDMYKVNRIINDINNIVGAECLHKIVPPKSGFSGHLGICITVERRFKFEVDSFLSIENVVFADEDE